MTDNRGLVPQRLGEYVLERRLGSGGMGVVHLARTVTGRRVAIKVIRPEYAEHPGFRARFRREVAAARRVSGAFTAPVVDADPEDDPPWLATLYVPGGSLADRLDAAGPLPVAEAARVGAQLAEALRDIHRSGLVHRDLKPGNVLLAEDGVRVIDFGISRAMSHSHRLTEAGEVLGSPPFMAPEQLTGADVTEAADVFALGAVVAYAATGHSPFEPGTEPGGDPLAVAYRVVHEEPDLGDVPEPLRGLVARCLAKDPARRPEVPSLLRMASFADTAVHTVHTVHAVHPAPPAGPPAGAAPQAPAPDAAGAGEPATGPVRAGRRRARLVAGAVALAVAGAAATGVWLAAPADPDRPATAGTTVPDGGGERPEPAAAGPWEIDLREFGVDDAITEGFRCRPADGGLLCAQGPAFAVLLGSGGEEVFRHRGPRDAVGGPGALPGEGAVLAPSAAGVSALGRDGAEQWRIDAPELTGSLLRVGGSLALQNGDSTLRFYAADAPEARGEWTAPGRYVTQSASGASRLLVETRADATGADPLLMLLDDVGRELWAAPVGPPPEAVGMTELLGMDADAAYFQEHDTDLPVVSAVLRLDLSSGAWRRTELPRSAEPYASAADGVVYLPDATGLVTAVDTVAGEVLWSRPTGADQPSRPAAVDGVLYLTDGEGRLHEVAADTGEVLHVGAAHPGTPGAGSGGWAPAPVIADGVAYAVTVGNTLYAQPLERGT
ncbi:serine/threonine-protein kinase [Streptomyces sp. MP131-18]|uniref:serine/threonine-protein kinase n=1 Tax=Streptomyces sp. MP131-18 TaxID=1857892 RepID=UPI00097BB7F5|nr:serine/threonine-protein kinase [Streptomyces sp. MP131-18]ONK12284.1 Serine/threonine-protein kinase AfsK [Streptomyces sp. MP131-18]